MSDSGQLVGDLGEQHLLRMVQRFCSNTLIGDDGAILSVSPGHLLVVTTDSFVDGVHFCDRTLSPFDVGWRVTAANLSDLAAMGANPLGITVSLTLPNDLPSAWVQGLYEGINACLTQYDTPLIGGDLCGGSLVTVAITALGETLPHRVIRRDFAQVGDAIVVTGYHGGSKAGLELLLDPQRGEVLTPRQRQRLINCHQHPRPRLDVLPELWKLDESLHLAGMDSSDGLGDAIAQICRASQVGAVINLARIPIPPGFSHWLEPETLWDWVFYGGEDFELVLCLAPALARSLVANLGPRAAIIGQITASPRILLQDAQGHILPQTLSLERSFQHYAPQGTGNRE
ncbi:thiamine-phosphate kinase [Spirulina subsalsa FACHB-351]|uniref:Thiamine-monophosphate kinase n=1 Tax=Spirulina subsalsa FACHB-351 TaxID=234711 RepID=A0ABT3L3Y5_9CYAN|nr:thiamine-phosphate kinase [Spirulina subsalsa]MCW6036214.1 thiamine-phosphate kinase [Spirulina subsalsa FACHB-351]